MTNYELVLKKIQEACPDIIDTWYKHNCGKISGCNCKQEDLEKKVDTKDPNISHILRTLGCDYHTSMINNNTLMIEKNRIWCHYELEHNSLEWHSINKPEVIDFLAKLLK